MLGKIISLGFGGTGKNEPSLSASDIALLNSCEELMPEGGGSCSAPLVTAASCAAATNISFAGGQAPPNVRIRPAVRRCSDAVLDELRRYFEEHPQADGQPANARTILGSRLVHWATSMQEQEPSLEIMEWWCEFLRRIEDARLFTRSNWARTSNFEEALSHCRLILVDLRAALREDALNHGLESLREALHAAHCHGRNAADQLLELLYILLRPRPAVDRCCFHDLEGQHLDGNHEAFHAVEDRLVGHLLELERFHLADALAPVLVSSADKASVSAGDEWSMVATLPRQWTPTLGEAAKVRDAEETVTSLRASLESMSDNRDVDQTRIPRQLVQDLGPCVICAFLELHGLYGLLAALLKRLDLTLTAVRDYAQFICFLPVHQTAILDLDVLYPQLRRRILARVNIIFDAYERLPRATAPARRGVVLQKCQSFSKVLEASGVSSEFAAVALRSCTPVSTLHDFESWRARGQHWLQYSRIQLAAEALLPPHERMALDMPQLDACLQINGPAPQLTPPVMLVKSKGSHNRTALANRSSTAVSVGLPGLGLAVDEDTKLYDVSCAIASVSRQVCAYAVPACARLSDIAVQRLQGLLPLSSARSESGVEQRVAAFLGIAVNARGRVGMTQAELCDDDWVMVGVEASKCSKTREDIDARPTEVTCRMRRE